MTRIGCLLVTTTLLTATAAEAQRRQDAERPIMAAGIAQDVIEVEVNYNDSRIIVFAATPQPENPTSGIAVALVGPIVPHRMTHRTASGEERIEFVGAPQVFAIGAEPVVTASVSPETMIEAGLNAQATALPRVDQLLSPKLLSWREAFVDLKMERGLYTFGDADFKHFEGGLRRASIGLPVNAPPGEYSVRAVAFRDGRVVGEARQNFTLARTGLDETLFDLSRQHGLIYGFVAVLLGAVAGGIGAWFGRR